MTIQKLLGISNLCPDVEKSKETHFKSLTEPHGRFKAVCESLKVLVTVQILKLLGLRFKGRYGCEIPQIVTLMEK